MKFYKTIAEKGELKSFAVNDEFNTKDLISLIGDDQAFYWNKKINAITPGAIDLKDIFNFYRVKDVGGLSEVFSSENLNEYFRVKQQLQSILRSYRITKIKVSKYGIHELVPERVLKAFLLSEIKVLQDAHGFLQKKEWYDDVIRFFKSEKCATNVLTHMNFPIRTLDGMTGVNLTWQANFRFNPMPGYLNLFNMQKKDRYKIIPQDEDHVIYEADFRQFEVRTFCMIHPELEVDFSNRELYNDLAEQLGLDPQTAKQQIIAYGYGQSNERLDKVLNRSAILEGVRDDFYSWNGYPVIFRPGDSDKIKIHTIVQTISNYMYLQKLRDLLAKLSETNSKFMYPLHDSVIISLDKGDEKFIPDLQSILEDDVYKVKQCLGPNLSELKEIT